MLPGAILQEQNHLLILLLKEMKYSHAAIFNGIGGFQLAGAWMGWENVMSCEIDSFCNQVTKYYWPNCKQYEDIRKTDFTIYRGRIDVLTGGFPCQPFSVAGKQKGIDDDRYLWPEMLRAGVEAESPWIICENVTGIFSMEGKPDLPEDVFFRVDNRKLTRFDTSDHYEAIYTRQAKMLIGNIIKDLEEASYTVQTFVIPAAATQAPHRRDRVWIVAHSNNYRKSRASRKNEIKVEKEGVQERDQIQQFNESNSLRELSTISSCERCDNRCNNRKERQFCDNQNRNAQEDKPTGNRWKFGTSEVGEIRNVTNPKSESCGREYEQQSKQGKFRRCNCKEDVTNTECERGREVLQDLQFKKPNGFSSYSFNEPDDWKEFPTQTPICDGDDGLSSRLDTITFSKWRKKSIEAGGNAIVPHVAYEIFKAIEVLK